jgi:class 3 adenylate cyclase
VDDGRGALTATGLSCGSCGAELPLNAKFCNECGAPVTQVSRSAEYKQVTVLFADVVHSMDIAAAVGAERLREIMAELLDRSTAVVKRYGGTLSQFTGDGIMAVFGAPITLEDHAVRACLAALGLQEQAKRLGVEVQDRDGIDLQLRVGLNSGQVIAGEIGSASLGYTAIGEQVGMAQRMESVAPPGGVMLSASTARLVDGAAALGRLEMVRIKGAEEPVAAHRLLGMQEQHRTVGRAESNFVGRRWEMSAVDGLLERAVSRALWRALTYATIRDALDRAGVGARTAVSVEGQARGAARPSGRGMGSSVISRKLLTCSISEADTRGYSKYGQVQQKHQD